MPTLDQLSALLDQMDRAPIHEIMRDEERAAGRRVVVPGGASWLSTKDWSDTVVVSVDGNDVRLVAILARNPGHGALKRLITKIRAAQLRPVIVCPTYEMRQTVCRWGWLRQDIGRGWDGEERWLDVPGARP